MLLLMSVLLFMVAPCVRCRNAGSILFYKHRLDRDCWSPEDIARLRARSVFENVSLPVVVPPEKIDTKYIRDTVNYFQKAIRLAGSSKDHSAIILREAVADAIGGHLQSQILPNVRLAYYAGYIPYRSARHIHNFFEEIKTLLNTQGLGWRRPRAPDHKNITVSKIIIGRGKLIDPCSRLITKHDENGCIHLPHPQLDADYEPSAIALPFRSDGLVSLTSPQSENVLLKYYTTASRCILNNSPRHCRHTDFVSFNNELWNWLSKQVAPHLSDERLYAAYGGVLRVAQAVQSYGNGLSRRNLYEYENIDDQPKWNPWRVLTQSRVVSDMDWTPQLYIGIVLVVVLLITLLQMSYNFIFGSGCGCKCPEVSKTPRADDQQPLLQDQVSYAETSRSFPCAIPPQSRFSAERSSKGTGVRSSQQLKEVESKSASVGTVRTQRVYDLNENTEKIMSVIMSDYEGSAISVATTTTLSDTSAAAALKPSTLTKTSSKTSRTKPSSPPKIQAPIAELKLQRSSRTLGSGIPMYSTSTISRSEVTYRNERPHKHRPSYTCTVTGTCTCSGSTTSGSSCSTQSHSQSQSQFTKRSITSRSRDMAWNRRAAQVKKKDASTKSHSTTGTEADFNSYTTPPSRSSRR